ncbi:hypothetical protein [Deinococcus puniceus]|uniref:DUF4177 domain-containing protein n=1 Tax=Deinococcus puniceus TaxID=1182568 RepID=A0A172TBB6_9DEIO|nr:hypothetical protein [Deinococcus puniceus]ANE44300.1 hypothetical protein SU48_11585 [Deinococcus puniceus]
MAYEYKTYQLPQNIEASAKDRNTAVAEMVQQVITAQSQGGFEYFRADSFSVSTPPGCLSALFGAKHEYVTYSVLVFRKQI